MTLVVDGEKITVDVKRVAPSTTWKGDSLISFCAYEFIRKV